MAFGAREGFVIAAAHLRADARHRPDEILDHAVGIGMVHVEAVEFAIGGQVDAGLALNVEDHARGIETRLLAGQRGQPIGDRVGADGSGEDRGFRRHRAPDSHSRHFGCVVKGQVDFDSLAFVEIHRRRLPRRLAE